MKTKYSLSDQSIPSFAMSAGIGESVTKATQKLVDLQIALGADSTKTPKQRELHYLRSHEKELDTINKLINQTRASFGTVIREYNERVDKHAKVLGTTDQLIMAGHLQAIQHQDISPAKVVAMAMQTGNPDGIRAMLLSPAGMYDPSFASQRGFLYESLEKVILGDDFGKLADFKTKQAALDKLENAVVGQYRLVTEDAEAIESKIVPAVAA